MVWRTELGAVSSALILWMAKWVNGRLPHPDPNRAIRQGLSLIPKDRKSQGLCFPI
jgi:hypothetical protein